MKSSRNIIKLSYDEVVTSNWVLVDLAHPADEILPTSDSANTNPQQWMPKDLDSPVGVMHNDEYALSAVQTWTPNKLDVQNLPAKKKKHIDLGLLGGPVERAVAQAFEEANRVIEHTQNQVDKITQEAYEKGIEKAKKETEQLLTSIQTVSNKLNTWRDEITSQSEEIVLGLVAEIAHALFGDGMVLEQEVLQQAYHKVISQAGSLGNFRIYVHPEDKNNIDSNWSQQVTQKFGQSAEWILDENIKRGGILIEGRNGSVDGRVEIQLQMILDMFNDTPITSQEISR